MQSNSSWIEKFVSHSCSFYTLLKIKISRFWSEEKQDKTANEQTFFCVWMTSIVSLPVTRAKVINNKNRLGPKIVNHFTSSWVVQKRSGYVAN